MPSYDFDLFVIGGGSGGVRAARMAAQRGARVGMAESGPMGGTCVNVGCIPKKLYSYAAGFAEDFADAAGFGWQLGRVPRLDWATLKAQRAKEITRLNGIYEGLMTGANVRRLQGHARLVAAHTVEVVSDGVPMRLTARHLLIATGGQPWVPDFAGRELVVSSDDMFDLPAVPRRLVVVGGGYIGCEMASIFHGLGAEVTLIYRGEQILRGFDDEVRDFAADELRKAGVDVRVRCDLTHVSAAPDGTRLVHLADGGTLPADVVLSATGRRANVAGLGLAELGVRQKDNGAIVVDEHFATSVPGIYALGDVVGRKELTPVALAEAMALVDQLFGPAPGKPARRMSYANIPTAVFTHPPIAAVGLTEAEARAQYGAVRIYRSDFRPLRHTLSGRSERTLVKLVVDDASDRVLGLHMVGADAGEIVQGFAVALQCGATKAQFDATLGIHPTSAEEFVTLREVTRR